MDFIDYCTGNWKIERFVAFPVKIIMIHDHRVMCCGTPEEVLTPENMETVFNIDAELGYDSKNGKRTVFLHGVARRD